MPLKEKFDFENKKLRKLESHKYKLVSSMQDLMDLIEQDKNRHLEEVGKALHMVHQVTY